MATILTREILDTVRAFGGLKLVKASGGRIAHIWQDDVPLCEAYLISGYHPWHNVEAGKDRVCNQCVRHLTNRFVEPTALGRIEDE